MKKFLALAAAAVMAASVAGCGGAETGTETGTETNTNSDLAYIRDKGNMVIGYTIMEPLNYEDENGDFVGFETEFATAVCDKLGVEPEFQLIDWDAKESELSGKTIDCIWNGLTITDERKENMSITDPYLNNRQVLVVKADKAEQYKESLDGAAVVVEAESAGDELANSDESFAGATVTAVDAQATALMDVEAGTSDVAVIDFVMASSSIGEGTSYEDLVLLDLGYPAEQYGAAFRKGSDVTDEVNKIIDELISDGTLPEIAEKYGLTDILITD